MVHYHTLSPDRETPFCGHFGLCGGCRWQHLPYSLQLHYKHKQVADQLERIGKLSLPELRPILGSEETRFYRNKLEFSFTANRWITEVEMGLQEPELERRGLGFHVPGMFDKVFHVDQCWLQPEPSNKIRNFLYGYALNHALPFYHIRNGEGFLRSLIVRTSSLGEVMVILSFFREDMSLREKLLISLQREFPEITSLFYVINGKGNDTITDQEVLVWRGRDYIVEEMEGLRFKIGPKSFYQTNSRQAYNLYKVARDFAQLSGSELVYDLYTGTGTIANFVSRSAKKVVGIEYVPEAIEDAKENSRVNGIENTLFFAGDMKDVLTEEFIATHGRPDVIITDPPRAGMHDDVIAAILLAEPQRVVYVSCNPATQARDLNLLDSKYRVARVQPVDMFPHTHHVENVVLLTLR